MSLPVIFDHQQLPGFLMPIAATNRQSEKRQRHQKQTERRCQYECPAWITERLKRRGYLHWRCRLSAPLVQVTASHRELQVAFREFKGG
jgi:hypothetical protein